MEEGRVELLEIQNENQLSLLITAERQCCVLLDMDTMKRLESVH